MLGARAAAGGRLPHCPAEAGSQASRRSQSHWHHAPQRCGTRGEAGLAGQCDGVWGVSPNLGGLHWGACGRISELWCMQDPRLLGLEKAAQPPRPPGAFSTGCRRPATEQLRKPWPAAVRRPGPAGLPLPTIESPQCLLVTALRTRPAQAPFKRPCLRTRTAPATSLPGLAPPGTSMCLCVACFVAPCASPAPGSFPIIPRQVLSVGPGYRGWNALRCSGA